jgi:copper(I)-binding protein
MRLLAFFTALSLATSQVLAQDDHAHLSEANGLRIVHAWTPATTGTEALIYLVIENETDSPVTLSGAEAPGGMSADLVGFTYTDGTEAWQVLPAMPIAAGQHLDLTPRSLALRLSGLTAPLTEGDEIEIEVLFGDLHMDVHVKVEAEGATAHSHAGHSH